MGMREQYITDPFKRKITVFEKPSIDTTASGSAKDDMGSSYIILGARITEGLLPIRLRLYGDATSRDLDASRLRTNPNVGDTVALSADIYLDGTPYTFDPPLIATTLNGEVFWNLSGSAVATKVELITYPIEKNGGLGEDRRRLLLTASNVAQGSYVQGNVSSPKSFIILTGSADRTCRVRLYSVPIEEVPPQEVTRPFSTKAFDFSELIADFTMSANIKYPLIPPLEGFTWEPTNLYPSNRIAGYVIDNNHGSTTSISASLYIYELEE